MTFYEFLEAIGRENLIETIKERDPQMLEALSGLFLDLLRQYFYIGGMPAAVDAYIKTDDLNEVRRIQNLILETYKADFSKHIKGTDIPKVRMLWDTIPVHLAREKKKFIYKDIKTGGRASEFENALDWLVHTGLVYKVNRALEAKIPLSRDVEREAFKLFMLDVGLLCAKSDVNTVDFYIDKTKIFSNFHGALTEQYVCQQLKAACVDKGSRGKELFYWGRDKGAAEVDFLMQYKGEIIPIEVKSTYNTRSQSLDVYMDLNKPKIAVKTSMKNLGQAGPLHSIPLYMLESLAELIKR
jgi:predicted AAA+ superfamily ATPase